MKACIIAIKEMLKTLKSTKNLEILESLVENLIVEENKVKGNKNNDADAAQV